jgi:F-box interacting protein
MACDVANVGDGGSAAWRRRQSPPAMVSSHYFYSSGVTVSGAIHFLSHNEEDVLRFDLENEEWKLIQGPPRMACQDETITIAELNDALCLVQTMPREAIIWLLVDSGKNIWVNSYTIRMDTAVKWLVPLRVLRLGGKLLFYCHNSPTKPMLQVYDPFLNICTDVKTPANVMGEIGLCSSHFDPRLICG